MTASISHVVKTFSADRGRPIRAVDDVSLTIPENACFTLLGPSGCGKTTLLRLLAGFEQPDSGEIALFGEPQTHRPPESRPVNTVFQNYSLFPHMTVAENVGFGLRMKRQPAAVIRRRVAEILALVQMKEFASRQPAQLSGGQQQRVALARALAPSPRLLLLDEPLSALDRKLREGMQAEIKRLQRETGITFLMVTHDQEEALAISDRIAVMRDGRVEQEGTPREIYDAPKTRFVAQFIGEMSFIPTLAEGGDEGAVRCRVSDSLVLAVRGTHHQGAGVLAFRPEDLHIAPSPQKASLPVKVKAVTFLGSETALDLQLEGGGTDLRVRLPSSGAPAVQVGEVLPLAFRPGAGHFFAESGVS